MSVNLCRTANNRDISGRGNFLQNLITIQLLPARIFDLYSLTQIRRNHFRWSNCGIAC